MSEKIGNCVVEVWVLSKSNYTGRAVKKEEEVDGEKEGERVDSAWQWVTSTFEMQSKRT